MSEKVSGATDDAEEPTQENEEQSGSQSLLGTEDEMLELARDMGHVIGEPKRETPESEESEEPEEIAQPESAEEKEPSSDEEQESKEESEEEAEEEEPEKIAADGKSWPESAKARVAEETAKRKQRTEERDRALEQAKQLYAENQRLSQQLAQAQAPRPNGRDPLADVFDETGIRRVEQVYKNVIRMAELHPEGAYDVPIKQADGSEKKMDFSREQLVDMKLEAEEMLRDGIPQRRQYLNSRIRSDNETKELYPELVDPESGWVNLGRQFLTTIPELQRDPEAWRWIARAIRGYQVEMAMKDRRATNGASAVAAAKRQVKAPVVPKTRGAVRRTERGDVNAALKELETKGDAASGEKWLEAAGIGVRKRSRVTE